LRSVSASSAPRKRDKRTITAAERVGRYRRLIALDYMAPYDEIESDITQTSLLTRNFYDIRRAMRMRNRIVRIGELSRVRSNLPRTLVREDR